jgi:type II secretory ATPase GspE/PulE/Tfp pilus assembly ATPase PilB-like protein
MQLYRSVGHDKCNHTGYSDLIGLYELLEVTDEFRKHIGTDTDTSILQKAAVQSGMKTMFKDGLLKLSLGIIDIKEFVRVVYA